MLQARNITFNYRKTPVLKDVSVSFPENKFSCIIGPNGAGKTTLLRCLAGIISPKSGDILFENKIVENNHILKDLNISYLPHRPDVVFPFTAMETVSLGVRESLLSLKSTVDRSLIIKAMKDVDCEEFADRLITELSAGELQRVFIAQAIVSKPKVLLLDEPTSSLDLGHQLDLMSKLKTWSKNGTTVIAVMHDINLAAAFADHISFLKSGQLVEEGPIENVFTEDNIKHLFNVSVKVCIQDNNRYLIPK